MTPRERYDAAVHATALLRAIFNDLGVADEDLRRDIVVAASATERIAGKLYAPDREQEALDEAYRGAMAPAPEDAAAASPR